MSSELWGMDENGEQVSATGHAYEVIQDAITTYIRNGLAIAASGGLDEKTIYQIRHLHLAEPWLPAVRAVDALKAAGLDIVVAQAEADQ